MLPLHKHHLKRKLYLHIFIEIFRRAISRVFVYFLMIKILVVYVYQTSFNWMVCHRCISVQCFKLTLKLVLPMPVGIAKYVLNKACHFIEHYFLSKLPSYFLQLSVNQALVHAEMVCKLLLAYYYYTANAIFKIKML